MLLKLYLAAALYPEEVKQLWPKTLLASPDPSIRTLAALLSDIGKSFLQPAINLDPVFFREVATTVERMKSGPPDRALAETVLAFTSADLLGWEKDRPTLKEFAKRLKAKGVIAPKDDDDARRQALRYVQYFGFKTRAAKRGRPSK